MYVKPYGTAFTGYIQLTNAVPGPVTIPIRTAPGGVTRALLPTEKIYLTSVAISSNDTAIPLVFIDLGVSTYSVISAYAGSGLPPYIDSMTSPPIIGQPGIALRASAGAVTAAKTVEIKITGYISAT